MRTPTIVIPPAHVTAAATLAGAGVALTGMGVLWVTAKDRFRDMDLSNLNAYDRATVAAWMTSHIMSTGAIKLLGFPSGSLVWLRNGTVKGADAYRDAIRAVAKEYVDQAPVMPEPVDQPKEDA